ncbi:Type II secretory pathway ATPase GspE/PulE or T4P pilus assembly pathway ATPase PilB [Singulisphaera sp. GP187]|uniref:GspE/PulE family protein n=1 Tax=Singulisphaera sp. GP187 TaxID=1882752 RepID=UPI0009279720|nr:GspE/PulE family protein [Singulisphaera sp. GP187]SIN83508.1 Type II secretory pathway ATPase GspE/PulE or T4P pilus assembly pathway ATPase PilB [Singulisphaera sp. GP187]
MIRPRLALATFTLMTLGATAGAYAAESAGVLLAQAPGILRGPGMYLNLFKFLPVLAVFVLWAWTSYWIDDDAKELVNPKFEIWNSVVFFSGILGFAMVWAIPIYPISLTLLLLSYFVPLLSYIYTRNQTVPDDSKVLTFYHLGEVMNDLMNKAGMKGIFNKGDSGGNQGGPPIEFVGKSQGASKADPTRVAQAEESRSYTSAKELVYDAVLRRATDIHFEPTTEQLSIRYRIDGILHAAEPFDRPTGDAVINVFKVLGALDISEKRKPQDGSFGAKLEGRELEFRVATSGSKSGEKMVMRILDSGMGVSALDEAGLRPKLATEIRGLVTQPHGMFLCCGPTGSGKTTTLYACLREIDRFQKNIITVEDPIEYHLDNITQMEINSKSGQTFSGSLRSILRQDPDVIMIGEIRDQETATIACQAATTGHMVFSTVHANDTVTALFRLLDLGVEPFMIASALTAVLGQRLVRMLCENCKEPYKPKPEFLKKANLPADKVDVFYRRPAEPQEVCPQCGGTGYLGRTGIFELLIITEPMRDMIRENPSLNAIKAEARKNGMIYLQEDGLRQVIQGKTSIDELLRVVK